MVDLAVRSGDLRTFGFDLRAFGFGIPPGSARMHCFRKVFSLSFAMTCPGIRLCKSGFKGYSMRQAGTQFELLLSASLEGGK